MSGLSKRIEPFRALMYNREIAREPARVVAPPYDLIGAARQRQLYERSPYNVVRLELGREADRYGAAEKTLAEWLAAGVVERRARPAIFQYTQSFDVEGRLLHRTGFIARVRLEEFDRGRIVPHERTFPAAKEDRLRLLTALQVNTELDLRTVLGRPSRARPVARAGRLARAADRSRRRPGNPQRAAADRGGRRDRRHSARARIAAHSDRRRTPSLRDRAELSAREAPSERVERAGAVRIHDDDAGGVRRSGVGNSADASGGEVAARRCGRVVHGSARAKCSTSRKSRIATNFASA